MNKKICDELKQCRQYPIIDDDNLIPHIDELKPSAYEILVGIDPAEKHTIVVYGKKDNMLYNLMKDNQ